MNNRKIILPNKRYFNAPEEDLNVQIHLDESTILLREGDTNNVLNLSTLFSDERNASINYKIHGKLSMVFRNMYSGTSTYSPLENNLYLTTDGSNSNFNGYIPYNEFAFLRNDVLREKNIPPSGYTLGVYSPNIIPTTGNSLGHIDIPAIEAPYHNWNIYLSYVDSSDSTYPMMYTLSGNTDFSFVSGDGIPFRVDDTDYRSYILTSPVEHGMSAGEYITISGGTLDGSVPLSGRTFLITSVGDEFYNSEKYVLTINKSEIPTGTTLSLIVLGKRCIDINDFDNTLSTYYVHKHKTLTDTSGYILDNLGFESSIWREERKLLFQNAAFTENYLVERNRMEDLIYDFKTPFTLSGITNNLGYTPTEVYVTIIFRNGNGYFDYPVKNGYKFNFHDSWIDDYFSGTTSIETSISGQTFTKTISGDTFTFISGNTLPIGTELNGAFIEYNLSELKERVISESFHKFTNPTTLFDYGQDESTVYSGASVDNKTGLYYQPHHRVMLRQLSPYLETYDTDKIYGLPQNAKYFEKESVWKWRDVYDHGFIDTDGFGTNFPYINNIHYVKNNINFYLRNEQYYTNKNNGVKKFKKTDC